MTTKLTEPEMQRLREVALKEYNETRIWAEYKNIQQRAFDEYQKRLEEIDRMHDAETKKEICDANTYIVKGPLVRVRDNKDDYKVVDPAVVHVEQKNQDLYSYTDFEVAKCELPKGHEGRHSTSKVTDFFKKIEW